MEITLVTTMTREFPIPSYYSAAINKFKDLLSTGFMGYMSSDQCAVCVVNASGQQILSTPITSSWTEVDINAQPNGIYILHVSLNNKETTWKIIKK